MENVYRLLDDDTHDPSTTRPHTAKMVRATRHGHHSIPTILATI